MPFVWKTAPLCEAQSPRGTALNRTSTDSHEVFKWISIVIYLVVGISFKIGPIERPKKAPISVHIKSEFHLFAIEFPYTLDY